MASVGKAALVGGEKRGHHRCSGGGMGAWEIYFMCIGCDTPGGYCRPARGDGDRPAVTTRFNGNRAIRPRPKTRRRRKGERGTVFKL